MNIEVQKEHLERAIALGARVANKNLSLPVLGCVVIVATNEYVVVRATNLDVSVELAIKAKVVSGGVVAVPAHILLPAIQTATDQKLILTAEETTLNVSGAHGDAKIKTIDAAEFPTLPFVKEGEGFSVTLPARECARALKSVSFAASTSGMRPELSSIFFEVGNGVLTTAATDSFRLAEMKIPVKSKASIDPTLIPNRTIPDILRLLADGETVELRRTESQVTVIVNGDQLTSRVIDGAFPEYQAIIPKQFTSSATILTEDAVRAFRKVSVFTDQSQQITITLSPKTKKATIEAKNTSVGETNETLDAVISGDEITMHFNARYITDALSAISSDSIEMQFVGPQKPLVVRDVPDRGFLYLVMPMNR